MSIDVTPKATDSLNGRVAAQTRAVMAFHQIRQSELARKIGVTEQWLSVRLRGVQMIGLDDLEKIAAGIGVQVAELFPRSDREVTVTYSSMSDVPAFEEAGPSWHIPAPRRPADTRPGDRRPAGHPDPALLQAISPRHHPNVPARTSRVHPVITS